MTADRGDETDFPDPASYFPRPQKVSESETRIGGIMGMAAILCMQHQHAKYCHATTSMALPKNFISERRRMKTESFGKAAFAVFALMLISTFFTPGHGRRTPRR